MSTASELVTPEPSVPNPPGCKCGAERHATDPDPCASGHTLPGAFMSTMHALKSSSDRLPPEFAHLAAELLEFEQASIADDGGAETVAHRRRSPHGYRAPLHRRIVQLDSAMELKGLFDKRGKLRVPWLQQRQSLINRAKGIDSLLGLDRRPRKLQTLEQTLKGRIDSWRSSPRCSARSARAQSGIERDRARQA